MITLSTTFHDQNSLNQIKDIMTFYKLIVTISLLEMAVKSKITINTLIMVAMSTQRKSANLLKYKSILRCHFFTNKV